MKLVPTPCLIVERDTPILEVIHLMQLNNQSFVLIKNSKGIISGIFTDRDLLMKFDEIVENQNLSEPVFKVMSTPVRALPIDLIHTAIEFMHINKIRHVPIVNNRDPLSEANISGIITVNQVIDPLAKGSKLRDVFASTVPASKRKLLGVVSPDGIFFNTLEELMAFAPKYRVHRIWMKDLRTEASIKRCAELCDAILIDVDEYSSKEWPKTLRIFNEHPDLETVIVVYNPDLHTARVVETFERIKSVGWLHVFAKPIDISALISELNNEKKVAS